MDIQYKGATIRKCEYLGQHDGEWTVRHRLGPFWRHDSDVHHFTMFSDATMYIDYAINTMMFEYGRAW